MTHDQQLAFDIETALPRPGDVSPMLPVPADAPFDDPDVVFGPCWGGRRALVFVEALSNGEPGPPRIVDADGVDVELTLPELRELPRALGARSVVLDGELVVVTASGRADAAALETRLSGGFGRAVSFIAFDLLYMDGRRLLHRPLSARLEALDRIAVSNHGLVLAPRVSGDGRALHAAVTQQGIAGVLARQWSSPYLPGVRSSLWRLIPAGAVGDPTSADVASDGDGETADDGEQRAARPGLTMALRLPLDPPER